MVRADGGTFRTDDGSYHRSAACPTCGGAMDPRAEYCPHCGTAPGSLRSRVRRKLRGVVRRGRDLVYGVVGWSLVLSSLPALAVAVAAAIDGAFVVALFAIAWWCLLVGTGLLINPRFGRQLSRRHAPSTFGRVRTVDHRVVGRRDCNHVPCTACGERFDVGVVRRRRDEFVVAGIPVHTFDIGHNRYCLDCEETGRFGGVAVDGAEHETALDAGGDVLEDVDDVLDGGDSGLDGGDSGLDDRASDTGTGDREREIEIDDGS